MISLSENSKNFEGSVAPSGDLSLKVIRGNTPQKPKKEPLRDRMVGFWNVLKEGLPSRDLPEEINQWRWDNISNLWRGAWRVGLGRLFGLAQLEGSLYLTTIRLQASDEERTRLLSEYALYTGKLDWYAWAEAQGFTFERTYLGLASLRVVTTAGVNYIVDAFQNSVEPENMKFHGLGTGSTAENVSDTTLVTELTTEYTGDVRATGTTTEGASANVYRTVATNTLDGTPGAALREHGIFSASTSGTLLDRSVYSAITLSSGDGLQSTYDLTITAGS